MLFYCNFRPVSVPHTHSMKIQPNVTKLAGKWSKITKNGKYMMLANVVPWWCFWGKMSWIVQFPHWKAGAKRLGGTWQENDKKGWILSFNKIYFPESKNYQNNFNTYLPKKCIARNRFFSHIIWLDSHFRPIFALFVIFLHLQKEKIRAHPAELQVAGQELKPTRGPKLKRSCWLKRGCWLDGPPPEWVLSGGALVWDW